MRSNTGLVDELGDDLVYAFLVEKKYEGKFSPENAVALIDRIRVILDDAPGARSAAGAGSKPQKKAESCSA